MATHVSRNLHRQIVRRPEYKDGQYEEAITQVSPQFKIMLIYSVDFLNFKYYIHPLILIIIILQGFLEADEKMRHDESLKDEMSGSTAIMALLRYFQIIPILNLYKYKVRSLNRNVQNSIFNV